MSAAVPRETTLVATGGSRTSVKLAEDGAFAFMGGGEPGAFYVEVAIYVLMEGGMAAARKRPVPIGRDLSRS